MLRTDKVIVVEGKYDAIRLANIIDATIIRTDGFGIFKDKEKQQLLRTLAEKRGLIVLTDSDSAGFLIRNFLKSSVPEKYITQVYIPDIYGKERRKDQPSAEGKLGVEGIPDEVLVECFRRAGVGDDQGEEPEGCREREITRADFYEAGLTGRTGSAVLRRRLQEELGLPSRLTGKQLLEVLNMLMDRETFFKIVQELKDDTAGGRFTLDIPKPVRIAIDMLETAGFEAYTVGGSVRDALLGREPSDWDITTSALPEQTEKVFDTFQVVETGIKHGTVTVVMDTEPLEITTYRIDGEYEDFRHPDHVTFTRSLREDLARRDFTVNALAYSPSRGLVDEFGGQQDLVTRQIRCVGDPDTRFSEDALRILRAVRFASVLDFTVEEKTADSVHRNRDLIRSVSAERIEKELTKLVCGLAVDRVMREFPDILETVLPEAGHDIPELGVLPTDLEIRMAALLCHCADPAAALRRLRFPSKVQKNVCRLVEEVNRPLETEAPAVRKLIGELGAPLAKKLAVLRNSEELGAEVERQLQDPNNCFTVTDLAINGKDLLDAGVPAGPDVGKTLESLLTAVQHNDIENTREALLASVKGELHGN